MAPTAPKGRVETRELRWTDFEPIRDIFYLVFEERETNPEIGLTLFAERPSLEDEVAWFAGHFRRVSSGETISVVGEHDGVVVGHVAVNRVGPTATSESAHIGELGILVHRDHRGCGVGDALMREVIRQSRGRFDLLRLSVFSVNTRARRLYERHGFVYIGTRPAHVKRRETYFDEDLMVLDLRPQAANR
jgi:ribosomal protein S18 acetylase RimI-like enzyme